MLDLLFLVPTLPFLGFLVLMLLSTKLSKKQIATVGVGSVGLSALLTLFIGVRFVSLSPQESYFVQNLWTWMRVDGFVPSVALYLDPLSLVMTLVVTFVGFLIHLYSAEFMYDEEGYSRFFAYMNLFVGFMLTLVLANNLLFLYLGWEGVGLCSYLLIGFWYKNIKNVHAANKAFIVTRVGDTAMAIALFFLFHQLGSLDIQIVLQQARAQWSEGAIFPGVAAALLLIGAIGKSAQAPLQVWLPDAMAGPSPVSALIHAATMVTAGVYLIARTHVLFSLAPGVQDGVAFIGLATLIIAGCSALTQWDIKRVLAYSTISQVGYMFLALGVGAWSAAIFHLITHAFFKALLFLGAGVVIHCLGDEHNMFKMGGVRKQLPLVFWTFLIGASSLSALPWITAGFYSKDLILVEAYLSEGGRSWLAGGGILGAFITSLYTFRMVFITFFGNPKNHPRSYPGLRIRIPLVILAILSILGGLIETPYLSWMSQDLPSGERLAMEPIHLRGFDAFAIGAPVLGVILSGLFFMGRFQVIERWMKRWMRTPAVLTLYRFWHSGWGFDVLYDRIIVRPFLWISRKSKSDVFDRVYLALEELILRIYKGIQLTQNGNLRWYALGIATGSVLFIGFALFSRAPL